MGLARAGHALIFTLVAFIAICEIVTSGILVGNFNSEGPPDGNGTIQTRVRYLLFCGLWTFVFCVLFIIGALFVASNVLFSIAAHLIWLVITLILFLSGAAALTSSIRGHSYPHQSRMEILEGFAWTDTVLIFIAIVFILAVGTKRGEGVRGGIV